jgi:hypothetical protein
MKRFLNIFWLLAAITAQFVACAPASPPATFTDPFAYCQAVGTIDAPDARYTGDQVPASVAKGLQKALGLAPDMPMDVLTKNSFWRCMDGKVYGCSVGANIPCESKVNDSKTPNEGMTAFCKENPNSDFIPAVATGRETIYAWKCVNGVPQVDKQIFHPDARGFISEFWYALSAN